MPDEPPSGRASDGGGGGTGDRNDPTGAAAPAARPRRRAAAIARVIAVNLALTVAGLALLLVVFPMGGNFTTLRKETLTVDESGIPRFRPNLRDEPYLHDSRYQRIPVTT